MKATRNLVALFCTLSIVSTTQNLEAIQISKRKLAAGAVGTVVGLFCAKYVGLVALMAAGMSNDSGKYPDVQKRLLLLAIPVTALAGIIPGYSSYWVTNKILENIELTA